MAATAFPPDWSRSGREFQLRVAACRRCLENGRADTAFFNCLVGLVEDVGAQVSEVRHDGRGHQAVVEGTLKNLHFRLFGFDDEEAHPEEVGVLGDLRNRLRSIDGGIHRAMWGLLAGYGLAALYLLEQGIQHGLGH